MLHIPRNLEGVEELETKILLIDPGAVQKILRKNKAQYEGTFQVEEQRYHPNKEMQRLRMSTRLRILRNGGEHFVEVVTKQKFRPKRVQGYEKFGRRLKRRKEFESELIKTGGNDCRYDTMKFQLALWGLKERDHFTTKLIRYAWRNVRFELETVLSYNGEETNLPPPFLEIEGPDDASIVAAAKAIGYSVNDFSPFTKRDVVKAYRAQTYPFRIKIL